MNGVTAGNHIELAYASKPHPGESVTGDLHLMLDRPEGPLVSVMDGLGHGAGALEAAGLAADVLKRDPSRPLAELIYEVHEELRNSRGIALTIAEIIVRESILRWAGIGNVEGRLLRARPAADRPHESVLLRGGVVGYQIPPIRPATVPIYPGDFLIFGTDGLSPSFSDGVILSQSPQRIAERIMNQHNRNKDDALVVVGRFQGMADG